MARQTEIYARVKAHPDYVRLRGEAEHAYAEMQAATDYDAMQGAWLVMAHAGAIITGIYDAVIAEMAQEEAP